MDMKPVSGVIGAEISGIDLSQANDEAIEGLKDALDEHLVVKISGQNLDRFQLSKLGAKFGQHFIHPIDPNGYDDCPEVLELLKNPDDSVMFGGESWHADITWMKPAGYLHGTMPDTFRKLRKRVVFFTTSIHEQNLFVTRGRDDKLRGFYNVCAHRGHELVSGSGKKNVITCPYHAWAFDFDGKLVSARNSENVEGFNKCEFSLKQSNSMVWKQEIRAYMPSVDTLEFAQRDTFDVTSNWKILVDNFLECYHCAPAHKDFVDLVDMNSYRTITHKNYSSQCAAAPLTTNSTAYSFEVGDVDFGYAGFFVWPNITIWIYPGEANLSVLQMNPAEPTKTIEYQDWFTPGGILTPQLKEAADYQKDILQPEDIGLCESVQRGLNSKSYNQGRFIVDQGKTELSEHAVHHFQTMVMDALGAEVN
ncbi:Carnitine monooxygenase oxygenase subunit [Nymphon striatum]|nr:Carnitine monooxygenase oxygenase subunit [Nymphon striatum]